MNKSQLIEKVAATSDTTKAAAERSLNAVLDTIKEELADGNVVTLIGFGTFLVRERAARVGRNPKTGAEIKISAAKVPAFRPGSSLKDAVQDKK